MSTLATIIQHTFESPSHGNHRRKRKRTLTGKEVKRSLFAGDMILYVQNSKDAIRNFFSSVQSLSCVRLFVTP